MTFNVSYQKNSNDKKIMKYVILLFLTVESRLFDLKGVPNKGHESGINESAKRLF